MLWRIVIVALALFGCQRSSPQTQGTSQKTASLKQAPLCDNGKGGEVPVPTTAADIQHWLGRGCYKAWPAWSKPALSGFAEIPVRVFLSPQLKASLERKATVHPVGVAAVREQFRAGSSTEVRGWSMTVKTRKDDGFGNGWFFYEVFDVRDAAVPHVASHGERNCAGCHSHQNDFVQSTLPLP